MNKNYLDRMAATPVHPDVLAAMRPFFSEAFGNPQSLHRAGQEAAAAVEEAREKVAALIRARSEEIVFTSCGSESNSSALKGLALANQGRGKHIVVSAVEHQSVLNSARSLEKSGFRVTEVGVDGHGRLDPADVEKALAADTVLVSVMTANNEVGTIEPVGEIGRICRSRNILFHTDAVAAAGAIPLDVHALGVDALSMAADQFYGPKGSAALFLKKGTRIHPLIGGGIQEAGRRGGTENVPGIVGMGKAAEIAAAEMAARAEKARFLRDYLVRSLPARIDHVVLTGHPDARLPHHASFCVEFVEGEAMLLSLDLHGISASSGSACTSRTLRVSHVLLAMGLDHALAQGSLVFGLIDGTRREDIDHLLAVFPPVVDKLRKISPLYTEYLKEKNR